MKSSHFWLRNENWLHSVLLLWRAYAHGKRMRIQKAISFSKKIYLCQTNERLLGRLNRKRNRNLTTHRLMKTTNHFRPSRSQSLQTHTHTSNSPSLAPLLVAYSITVTDEYVWFCAINSNRTQPAIYTWIARSKKTFKKQQPQRSTHRRSVLQCFGRVLSESSKIA